MIYLFVHGGPGLNSNPETNLLKQRFESEGHEIYFWNQPTAKGVSYDEACESLSTTICALSAKSKITIIAHSFGAFFLNEILPIVDDQLAKIILLSPATDLHLLDLNILRISCSDYAGSAESIALEKYIRTLSPLSGFNEERLNGLLLAASNPALTAHYWLKKELMPSYYSYLSGPDFSFNFDSFVSIRSSCVKNTVSNKTNVETLITYGVHDPFINSEDYHLLIKLYPNSKTFLFEESSHYSHIEERTLFYDLVFTPQ